MTSIHHRGTETSPGLVLALGRDDTKHCRGLAFRVRDSDTVATVDYLRERELVSSAYIEQVLPLELDDGDRVRALAYVVDTSHEQYVKRMPLEEQAQIIATAQGGRGRNCEYLWNTVDHLYDLGISDPALTWLAARVREIQAESV